MSFTLFQLRVQFSFYEVPKIGPCLRKNIIALLEIIFFLVHLYSPEKKRSILADN